MVAGRELRVHPVDALGRALEALPVGVLADLEQDLVDGGLDAAIALVRAGVRSGALDERPRPSRLLADLDQALQAA